MKKRRKLTVDITKPEKVSKFESRSEVVGVVVKVWPGDFSRNTVVVDGVSARSPSGGRSATAEQRRKSEKRENGSVASEILVFPTHLWDYRAQEVKGNSGRISS